ncbi:MAG: hypothetical protein Q8K24_11850 [Hydrogenophaga sp.]|nr:hypothetical protein [Hydrogenophaga sp.]
MTLQKLSALECPEVPSPTREREPEAVPCVLLQAGALPSDETQANEAHPPSPAAPEPAVEDESADPVGDGHSDAELAQKLKELPREVPRPGERTAPGFHPPPPDNEKGR